MNSKVAHSSDKQKAARAEFIAGLRQLADFLQANPAAPIPYGGREIAAYVSRVRHDEDGVAQVRAMARQLTPHPLVTIAGDSAECAVHFAGEVTWTYRYLFRERVAQWEALHSYAGSVRPEVTS